MNDVKKCNHCGKCYFPIAGQNNDKCPFCGKYEVECPEFMKDIIGGFERKD